MPYTKDQARVEITQLVANFRANEASLADVPEAQIESNYIRKLFQFLNWNTNNIGLSVADWEFVLQRTDDKGKRPDYILQLDGQQVLLMDAKKVKYDMHDSRWMQQVYAYAYSTQNYAAPRKIDFAILTDFQELVLLDCTLYAASPQTVSNFRILDWTCDDYVSQFDTLWELLERENVRATLHTRNTAQPVGLWARYLSPKKVKANRIPPDQAFLAEMDDEKNGWRVRLAKEMKKRNPEADGALITAAVQLLIDRLIFVKALSDREIEDDYLTQLAERVEQAGLAADDAGWFNACRDIFARLNQFYNGTVFKSRPELEAVTVSNKLVRDIIRHLQPENSPYNFAVLPVEILGTIYERFLGRVVRATDARVKVEAKPEVRKAGGVYYTPQYIVDYIVENTVGKLLAKCETPAEVAQLKIIDPACGSGSFLLGAYTALIRWHIAYYSNNGRLAKRDREAAYYDSDGRVRLTAKLKGQILLNNIFGVDIDTQAVEVTCFSLSLKALEDTRREELWQEFTMFKKTILPELDKNIKCGNSLIGHDYSLLSTESLAVKAFNWEHEFPSVFGNPPHPVSLPNGFDAVIGNPPYGAELANQMRAYFQTSFTGESKSFDSYELFLLKSKRLLNANGWISMIIPASWLTGEKYELSRRKLTSEMSPVVAYALPFDVFKDAYIDTAIIVLSMAAAENCRVHFFPKKERLSVVPDAGTSVPITAIRQDKGCRFSILMSAQTAPVLTKINAPATQFGDWFEISRGVQPYSRSKHTEEQIAKRFLHAATPKNKQHLPELQGSELSRYFVEPIRKSYLKYSKDIASTRPRRLFEGARLVLRRLLTRKFRLQAGYVEETLITTDNVLNLVLRTPRHPNDIKFALGVLNSTLISWVYVNTSMVAQKDDFPQVHISALTSIRLPNYTQAQHVKMVQLVESMLTLHQYKTKTQDEQDQLQRQLNYTDQHIDQLVYELYDLTPEEIAIVTNQP